MRTMKHWALAAAAAAALALAGCGGGGSSSTAQPETPMDPPPKTALSYATDLDNSVEALMALSGDADTEGSALMMAKDASEKIGTLASGGDSMAAMNYAAMVLKAPSDLEAAIEAAKEAKMAAEGAKDDTENRNVIAALDNAIKAADTQIMAAQALLDAKATVTGSLASYVQMVTGDDEDDLKTAANRGKEVADAIYTALTTTAQVPDPVALPNPHTTSATVGKLMMGPSDAQGMTWAEIGGSGLMDTRITASGGGTMAVKAKSVADMTAEMLGQSSAPATTDGTEVAGATYKGITGTLFCAGDDCGVEHADGATFVDTTSKLTGSWYFAPTAPSTTTYVAGAAAGTYAVEAETEYVRYGYWLSVASATDGTTTINRYHSGPSAQSGAVYGVNPAVDAFAGQSASYEGDAVGMAVVKTFDSKGMELSRASGHFDADVSLTMTFGTTQTLEGMITNFQGNAVDSSWMVELKESVLASGVLGTAATDGTVGGDATGGSWTATAWGGDATSGSEARPTGVFGAFDAEFTNGAVAGVYATRKQ